MSILCVLELNPKVFLARVLGPMRPLGLPLPVFVLLVPSLLRSTLERLSKHFFELELSMLAVITFIRLLSLSD